MLSEYCRMESAEARNEYPDLYNFYWVAINKGNGSFGEEVLCRAFEEMSRKMVLVPKEPAYWVVDAAL